MDAEQVEDTTKTTNNDIETKSVVDNVEDKSVDEAGTVNSDIKDESDPDDTEDDSIGDDFDNKSVAEVESIEFGDETTAIYVDSKKEIPLRGLA